MSIQPLCQSLLLQWTLCNDRTFALNNLQSVKFHSSFQGNDMFLVFSLCIAQCFRNCTTKQREALWTQWGKIPWLPKKGYFADWFKFFLRLIGRHQLYIPSEWGGDTSHPSLSISRERLYLKFHWQSDGIDCPIFIDEWKRKI